MCSNSSICANFFPAKIKRVECLARATHACVTHSFSKGEKRGTQYQYKYGRAKAKQNMREEGFAFARLMFLKFGGIGFPPRRRVREECGAGVAGL